MALAALSGDEQLVIFVQLCNVLDPGVAVAFGSASSELWTLTQAPRQQLQADHEAAAALGRKAGKRSCKELREAKEVVLPYKGLSSDDLVLLGTLGSVLPALERLDLYEPAAGPDGVQRLAEKLGAGALPAVMLLNLNNMHVGDAGASALAAALGRGALPRLKTLDLTNNAIGDAGLVALAPALRRLPALTHLILTCNPFGDEGLAARGAAPPAAGAPVDRGLGRLRPSSATPDHRHRLPTSPLRSTAARCRCLSSSYFVIASLPVPRRRPPCLRHDPGSWAVILELDRVRCWHWGGPGGGARRGVTSDGVALARILYPARLSTAGAGSSACMVRVWCLKCSSRMPCLQTRWPS